MLHEVEAHTAHAALVKVAEIPVGDTLIDNGDAAIAPARGGDRVEHGAVVAAVTARLHDDRALDAKEAMERHQAFLGRIGRRVAAALAIRKHRGRSEDMAMRIAG